MLFCFVGPVYNSPKPVLGRCCDVWKELINLHHLARMCWGLGSSIKGHWAPAWSPPLGALSLHLCSTTLKFDFSWCWGSVHFAFLFGWWQLVRVSGASGALCCHLGEVCFPVIASYFNSIAMVVLDTESARTCALWKHIDAIICIYESWVCYLKMWQVHEVLQAAWLGGDALVLPARLSALWSESGESQEGAGSSVILLFSLWRWP